MSNQSRTQGIVGDLYTIYMNEFHNGERNGEFCRAVQPIVDELAADPVTHSAAAGVPVSELCAAIESARSMLVQGRGGNAAHSLHRALTSAAPRPDVSSVAADDGSAGQ